MTIENHDEILKYDFTIIIVEFVITSRMKLNFNILKASILLKLIKYD
jgi:hypothetical protein